MHHDFILLQHVSVKAQWTPTRCERHACTGHAHRPCTVHSSPVVGDHRVLGTDHVPIVRCPALIQTTGSNPSTRK